MRVKNTLLATSSGLTLGSAVVAMEQADEEEFEDACALFEDFHGRDPDENVTDPENPGDIVELDDGSLLVYVGELSRVGYIVPKEDPPSQDATARQAGIRENLHTFGEKRKAARPLLYVDLDGQIVVLKGEYTFTERGFEDE
jgi:hypothetical protein